MDLRLATNLLTDRVAALSLAILYLTDRCNSRCITCDYWRRGQTDMPLERVRALAPELRRLGARAVLLSGGEPLLHPDWAQAAATLREAGLRVWLLTAGLSLIKHAARAAELCQRITVSLDAATPEAYRLIRGVDAFEAVCEGVRAAVGQGAWVSLRCTVQRANYEQLPAIVRLAQELGVRQISFLPVDVSTHAAFARQEDFERELALRPADLPRFRAVLDALEREFAPELACGFVAESPHKLRRLERYFAALNSDGPFPAVRCNAPRFSAVIGADAEGLQPCYFISGPARSSLIADGLSLPTALNTPEFIALRRAIRQGRRPECERCVCSMWRGGRGLAFGEF